MYRVDMRSIPPPTCMGGVWYVTHSQSRKLRNIRNCYYWEPIGTWQRRIEWWRHWWHHVTRWRHSSDLNGWSSARTRPLNSYIRHHKKYTAVSDRSTNVRIYTQWYTHSTDMICGLYNDYFTRRMYTNRAREMSEATINLGNSARKPKYVSSKMCRLRWMPKDTISSLPPPKKEVMFLLRSVFVCPSDNWKSCERILTKFLGGVGHR